MTASDDILFPPTPQAAVLYPGKVMHARMKPFGHRFNYRVFSILIDIDALEEADKASPVFSVNGINLVSFHERDHIQNSSNAKTLRAYVDSLLEEACSAPAKTVKLLAYPRILNFVFNPLSVYFCHDADDRLDTVIYEVRNTFGERHTYVCRVERDEISVAGLRQERTKIFYVSPFIDLGARYHFRVLPPGADVRLRIFETENGEPLLSATFAGSAQPFTTRHLLGQIVRFPFMTLKVVAGIHWQALKLWLKGAKFHSRGKPPHPVSYTDAMPTAE